METSNQTNSKLPKKPLLFMSHDTRDGKIAANLAELVDASLHKAFDFFRSSDVLGNQGIDFGKDWFSEIVQHLEDALDVIAILTKQSLESQWVMYETGFFYGEKRRPAIGVVFGISPKELIGPFKHFHVVTPDEDSLVKLVNTLAKAHTNLEPHEPSLRVVIQDFLRKVDVNQTNESPRKMDMTFRDVAMLQELRQFVQNLPTSRDEVKRELTPTVQRVRNLFNDDRLKMGNATTPAALLVGATLFRETVPVLYDLAVTVTRAGVVEDKRQVTLAYRSLLGAIEAALDKSTTWCGNHSPEHDKALEEFGRLVERSLRAKD